MESNTGRIEHRDDESGSGSQFPKRWEPLKGAYQRNGYSPRGSFGPREAGSTLAFSAAIQPAIIWASFQVEQMAEANNPTGNGLAVFGATYASTFLFSLLLKIFAGFLRNFGESLVRDLGAWLWINLLRASWYTFSDFFFGWLPWRNRHPAIWPTPQPTRESWWSRWRSRRNNRRVR